MRLNATSRAEAELVVRRHLVAPDPAPLRELYRAGWALGVRAATAAVRTVLAKADAPPPPAEVPPPAPPPVAPMPIPEDVTPIELAALLDQAGAAFQAISQSMGSQIATVITGMMLHEESTEDIAKAISGLLARPDRAHMVAVTETTRALTTAAYWIYGAWGVEQVEFLATDDRLVCPLCIENEEQGPIPITDRFLNGAPPVHPRCRCAVLPALEPLDEENPA